MGGGYYDQDVAQQARSSQGWSYQGHGATAAAALARSKVDEKLDPRGKNREDERWRIRECNNQTPIVVALDVTRSRGDDTRLVYEKLPMFIGQLEMRGYVQGPGISFAAVGDADADKAPIQVGQFEGDNRLDEVLTRFWIEEGGGGTGQESYELVAWYYAHHSLLREWERTGRKGYFFFIGDEGYYPSLSREQILKWTDRDAERDYSAQEIFAALQEKFHVFFIYPRQSAEDRQKNIDAEVRSRVVAAGGRYDGVDVRASLIWNNRNDLDLHMVAPSGYHIYYGAKRSPCGGWLDVDQNVSGNNPTPVENVQWVKGTAPNGNYEVSVINFRFHEADQSPTEYALELEVNGEIRSYSGVISPNKETGAASRQVIASFTYDPNQSATRQARYDAYSEATVLRLWSEVLPRENILVIDDSKAILDIMLGVLAIMEGKRDVDGYVADLQARAESEGRQGEARRALTALGHSRAPSAGQLPESPAAPRRGGATRLR
jgi:hypothetical protein